MSTLARELEGARQKLLDLTLRNRLLSYRPSQLRSIRVTGEVPAEVYDALVLREKTLEFRGTGRRKASEREEREDAAGVVPARAKTDAEAAVHRHFETWMARGGELEAKHTDRFLQTPHDDEMLARKLFRVYHEGRSAVEEQGYTVTHLALGFLEWYESEESVEPRRAPLILVPAELERVRAGDFSKVRWTGEDVFANISLQAKLVEHGVTLPLFDAPEEKRGIDAWLQQVVTAIAKKPRWRVLADLTLDFFSFTKFVMFKDLDPATWPADRKPHDHPLLQTLFVAGGDGEGAGFDEQRIDEVLTARDLWHVMDADPSQIAVLEEVKAGRNLVVQGPPGTGKSQTITNLIAESLAAGKTVLFVSEKMAALEVVKTRLDAAGLGPFCLELHSRKANKKSILQELQRSLGSKAASAPGQQMLDEHEALKRDLNRYARELGTPACALGLSPFQLFTMKQAALAQLGDATIDLPRIPYATSAIQSDLVAAENALRKLVDVLPLVQPIAAHPWRASTRGAMLPHEEEELRGRIAHLRQTLQAMREAALALANLAGVRQAVHLVDVETCARAAEFLVRLDGPVEISLLLGNGWNDPNPRGEELLQRVEAYQRDRAALATTFREDALDGNHAAQAAEFSERSTRLFRFFDGRYRTLRRTLAAAYAGTAPEPAAMRGDLARLVGLQAVRNVLRADATGGALYGARWKAERSDCAALRAFAEWMVAFRRELLLDSLTRKAADVASQRMQAEAILQAVRGLREAATSVDDAIQPLLAALCLDLRIVFERPVEELVIDEIEFVAERWESQLGSLFLWSQCSAARRSVRETIAAPLDDLVRDDRIAAGSILPLFRAALAETLLRAAFGKLATLGQFVGELHEKKIARFRALDRELVPFNRARLSRRLHERRPQIGGGASPTSEVGVLLGEMHRKRGHMPIRKLLTKAGGLVQRIKPCFLMSPLSIAQFLDPRSARFDLIVFDEASQVRPEDAVGALLRGSQLVVMGDTQQLPPTSFFDHLGGDDGDAEEEESAALHDVESILHQCARSYPSKMLNWHYRSRHESLIAISNLHFYDNRLRVYPSAVDRADGLGLHFVHIPHAVYDRGRSAVNREEARAIAAASIEHYRRHPDKTLGVGTFNIRQQQAILEEIELELRRHPEMEPFFKRDRREPFFVKNLETIQGDERDAILISVGYGRDAGGRLSLNFGPLNREGGERRLNVLISRAREKTVVYSNFTAADLPVDGATSKGMFALRSFLEYAETRSLVLTRSVDEDADAPFEDAVAEVLRAHGYEVRQRVGCAGFRVDLAVVDPMEHGRYLLGIECDGAKYHSATVARDRDRLREQILENLGWTIHRVWSVDWYRNRAETIDRLLQRIEEAKRAPRVAVAAPAESTEIAPLRTDDGGDETEGAEEVSMDEGSARVTFTIRFGEGEVEELDSVVVTGSGDGIEEYQTCRGLSIPTTGELHQVPTELLALAVEEVVRVEGPVHVDEVVRRIRTLWGLQRAGNRIRDAIWRATSLAAQRALIACDGDFLRGKDLPVRVRRRMGDPPARIDLIAETEIAEALRLVLQQQFATPREELVGAVARRFGILATSESTAARIEAVIDAEMARGRIGITEDVVQWIGSADAAHR